jgi:riboflavin biosynthesis pyrimidine reductase
MCTTIDGKIMPDRWGKLPGKGSGTLFETTAATFGVGAWIVGTTTMREFAGKNRPLKATRSRVPSGDHIAKPDAKGLAIGIDAKAALRFQDSDVDGDHVVLCITQRAGRDYRAHLRAAGASYLVCGEREVDLGVALQKLWKYFHLRKLMLEGGGTFNGSMLNEGYIDEISQVFVPVVDGGPDVTGVFDIRGAAPKKSAAHLKLISHRTLPGSVVWCRYRVIGSPKK